MFLTVLKWAAMIMGAIIVCRFVIVVVYLIVRYIVEVIEKRM